MSIDKTQADLIRMYDENRALLRDCLGAINAQALAIRIEQCLEEAHDETLGVAERLQSHCELIGMLSIIMDDPEAMGWEAPHA